MDRVQWIDMLANASDEIKRLGSQHSKEVEVQGSGANPAQTEPSLVPDAAILRELANAYRQINEFEQYVGNGL
jgi:hypothetical protein